MPLCVYVCVCVYLPQKSVPATVLAADEKSVNWYVPTYESWGLCPVVSGTRNWIGLQSWGFQSQMVSLNSYNPHR